MMVSAGRRVAVEPREQALGGERADLGGVLGHHGDPRADQVGQRQVVEARSARPRAAVRAGAGRAAAPMVTMFCEVNSAVGGSGSAISRCTAASASLGGAEVVGVARLGRRQAGVAHGVGESSSALLGRGDGQFVAEVGDPAVAVADQVLGGLRPRPRSCWSAPRRPPARPAGGRRRRSACPARVRPADTRGRW